VVKRATEKKGGAKIAGFAGRTSSLPRGKDLYGLGTPREMEER